MTTIVITHDLSQISSDDFVHVLKDGQLVEQGFRHELEAFESEFRRMARTQDATGGFKEKTVEGEAEELPIEAILDQQDEEERWGRQQHDLQEGRGDHHEGNRQGWHRRLQGVLGRKGREEWAYQELGRWEGSGDGEASYQVDRNRSHGHLEEGSCQDRDST